MHFPLFEALLNFCGPSLLWLLLYPWSQVLPHLSLFGLFLPSIVFTWRLTNAKLLTTPILDQMPSMVSRVVITWVFLGNANYGAPLQTNCITICIKFFFKLMCIFIFIQFKKFPFFFFFFFVGYEACGILVAWPEIKYAPSEAEALDCWGSPIVCIFNKIFTGLICLLKSEKHLPV